MSRFLARALLLPLSLLVAAGALAQTPPRAATALAPPSVPVAPAGPRVALETSMGRIVLELYPDKAPRTVANFLAYVKEGHYNGTVFHRVIGDFLIQGGAYTPDMQHKPERAPVDNESANGLSNLRGTLAAARRPGDSTSATAQFFINTVDNRQLDYRGDANPALSGYCVFGRVVEGMEVVDRIRVVPTGARPPFAADVPVSTVLIERAALLEKTEPRPRMTTLFVSDLHLHPSRPAISALFLDFLREEAAHAEALYILGDLFEAWLGDDADDALAQSVRAALGRLQAAGVPVFVMRGNRDFLFGARFAADSGATLLPDPCVVRLYGQPTLLMHGDLLCSDDRAYLAFRAQVRDPAWQGEFLSKSLAERGEFAARARAASGERQAGLKQEGALEAITDVNAGTVAETMARFGVRRMIHGHTHRPAIHSLSVDGQPAQRIVLGDWYEQGSVLRASPDGFELSALD